MYYYIVGSINFENVIHRGLVGWLGVLSSELSWEFSCYSENEVDRGPVESETQVNLVLCTLVESWELRQLWDGIIYEKLMFDDNIEGLFPWRTLVY